MPHSNSWKRCLFCVTLLVYSLSPIAGADPGLVDFGTAGEPGFFNFFGKLQPGPKELGGVLFELKDVMLRIPGGKEKKIEFSPVTAAGIHFLHFTENAGDRLGAYTLVYADGKRVEIPLQNGINIQDWWKPGPMPFAEQAFTDAFNHPDNKEQKIGFWRFSVRNPHPDIPLTGIEAVNSDASVTVNLIAVTLTPECAEKVGAVPAWSVGMDEEQFLLAVLNQPGDSGDKPKMCAQLARVGTVKSVPALAACLLNESTSHAARLALTAMEYPEACAALRDALPQSAGTVKAGLIESLGTLKHGEDAALIAPALKDADSGVALSAALALGRIGGPVSVKALKDAAQNASGRQQAVILDALLCCAESLRCEKARAAHALYRELYDTWPGGHVGTAAYKGMILTSGRKAKKLITAALTGEDPALLEAALPAIREVKGAGITKECGKLLGKVSRETLPGLIGALAQRGDRAASPALARMAADEDPAIALAAVKALALVGDADSVPVLVAAAAQGADTVKPAAMQALAQMNDPDVSGALLKKLKRADAAETAVLAAVMGNRRDQSVAPALRKLVQDKEGNIRAAAAQALGEVGGAEDAALLCKAMEQADNQDHLPVFSQALAALGKRLEMPEAFTKCVLDGLAASGVAARCALLQVCGELGGDALLNALNESARGADETERDAALRALAQSDSPAALPLLLNLLKDTTDVKYRTLLFKGVARLAADEDLDEAIRREALAGALALAQRPEEKRPILGSLGACSSMEALKTVEACLDSSDVQAEAAVAWGKIALALVEAHRDEIGAAAPKAFAAAQAAGLSKAAMQALTEVGMALNAVAVPADRVRFEHVVIDKEFRSEGVAVADVNRDGANDLIVGDYWYEAPAWKANEIRTPEKYDAANGYSRCFAAFAEDVDKDGWTDVIVVGFPGAPAYWYRNPGAGVGLWQEYLLATEACGETPLYADLTGDGKREPLFAMNSRLTWFQRGQDMTTPWLAYPMTHMLESFARFGHGLGVGDVNGDGRNDVLTTLGWWEGPADVTRPDWRFYKADLGPDCADMVVHDVNADGRNDILTSSAHEYGIWWFEQNAGEGEPTFTRHEIDKSLSETHALILADINNDGLHDFVTGKRYFAHGEHDPGALEPSLLCWYELQRPEPGKAAYTRHVIDEDSGVGTQFEVCDFDQDGLQDIVVSNKKGVHLFLQRRDK